MEQKTSILDHISAFIISLTVFATPLFFLPLTQDFYELPKWLLLALLAILALVLWGVRAALTNKISIALSPATWGFGALFVASILSTLVSSSNKLDALITPLGPVTFGALFLISLLCHETPKGRPMIKWALILSAAFLGVLSIYQFFGIGKLMFPTLAFLADPLWSPTGSPIATIAFLLLAIPLIIDELRQTAEEQHVMKLIPTIIVGAFVIAGVSFALIKFIPIIGKTLLPIRDGWAIMLEVFKNPKAAIFGVGPENFLTAFTIGRLPRLNTSSLWDVRFVTSSSLLLHVGATLGFIGAGAMFIFLRFLFPKKIAFKGIIVSLALAMISVLIVPPSIVLLVILFALMMMITEKTDEMTWSLPTVGGGLGKEVTLLSLIAAGAAIYGVGRIYASELRFYQSLQAAQKNDGAKTYNLQIEALKLNPTVSRFHLSYSQTNWALANAIASNARAQTQATESGTPIALSEQDRQTISALIQQAIREAKLAVNYAPGNVIVWENLANLYQNLTGVADGADQWTIATYQQALSLDPTNPLLRLRYGEQLLRRDLDAATQQFLIATTLKPDFANAHYHLAVAYNERKEYFKTALELRQALSFVSTTSQDYERVFGELADVKKKLTPQELALFEGKKPEEQEPENQLNNPKEQTAPQIEPKLQLPPEASPPASPPIQATPTPTSTPTPTQ